MITKVVYLESISWNTHTCAGRGVIVLPLTNKLGIIINSWSCRTCGEDDPTYANGEIINSGDIVLLPIGHSFYAIENDIQADKDSQGMWLSSKYGSTVPHYRDLHKIVNVSQCKGFAGDFADGVFEFKFRGMHYKAIRVNRESFELISEKVRNRACDRECV